MRPIQKPLTFALCLAAAPAMAASPNAVEPFPEAEKGFVRHVIQLPTQPDESARKLEILAGKTLEVDCNFHHFGGTLRPHNLNGWGYDYYRLDKVAGPVSTRMGCPDSTLTQTFVPVIGNGFMLRYDSKLPVVVYVPKDVEVRYRVWSASPDVQEAKVK